MSVVSVFEGLFALVLTALASLALARRTGLNAGLFPLVLFFFAGAALWLWFAVSRPVFLRWDEFSFWGTACKMTKVNHCLHPAAPGNLSARAYLPGMMVLSYLFQFFSAGFTEWECLAAYDLLALAVFAAFGAFEGRKWYLSALGMLGAGLLPYFFLAPGDTQAATVYLNAMGDVYLGLTFGGALCLYYRAGTRKAGLVLTALALAFLTLIKDMGFAYAPTGCLPGRSPPCPRWGARWGWARPFACRCWRCFWAGTAMCSPPPALTRAPVWARRAAR